MPFTLILLNPRGTDESSPPADDRAYTTADYVADVDELRTHLGEETINVLGHSHGGVVALAYAAAHPARVRRVVALDTLVRLQPDEMEQIMLHHRDEPWYDDARRALEQEEAGDYSTDAELHEITRRFWPMYFARFDEREARYADEYLVSSRGNPDALRLFNEGIEEWDMRPDLASITAPTLVLTGDQDFICGPRARRTSRRAWPGSKKIVIEDCGHFTFVERPERFSRCRRELPRMIDKAVDAIQRGKPIIVPTDTVYGIADERAAFRGGAQPLPAQASPIHATDGAPRARCRDAVRARAGVARARRCDRPRPAARPVHARPAESGAAVQLAHGNELRRDRRPRARAAGADRRRCSPA